MIVQLLQISIWITYLIYVLAKKVKKGERKLFSLCALNLWLLIHSFCRVRPDLYLRGCVEMPPSWNMSKKIKFLRTVQEMMGEKWSAFEQVVLIVCCVTWLVLSKVFFLLIRNQSTRSNIPLSWSTFVWFVQWPPINETYSCSILQKTIKNIRMSVSTNPPACSQTIPCQLPQNVLIPQFVFNIVASPMTVKCPLAMSVSNPNWLLL